jgi:predicted transcriptional regulator
MKTLSLKLDDSVFQETEQVVTRLKKPRNRYINEALLFYNRLQRKRFLSKKIEDESKLVQEESLKVMAEFDNLEEYDY